MKKETVRLLALLIFGATALTSCSMENQGYRDRSNYGRYHNNRYRSERSRYERYQDRNNQYQDDRHHYINY